MEAILHQQRAKYFVTGVYGLIFVLLLSECIAGHFMSDVSVI